MSETDYNTLLYEKVQAEYDSFIDELKTKPVDEVVEKAYEKVMKEEMVCICEFAKQDQKDMLRDSVDDSAKAALMKQRENARESR